MDTENVGRDKMIELVALAMSEAQTIVNVPLAEHIVDRLIAESGGDDHVLVIEDDGDFYLAHPITERYPGHDLGSCRTFRFFLDSFTWDLPEGAGRYLVRLDENGHPIEYVRMES